MITGLIGFWRCGCGRTKKKSSAFCLTCRKRIRAVRSPTIEYASREQIKKFIEICRVVPNWRTVAGAEIIMRMLVSARYWTIEGHPQPLKKQIDQFMEHAAVLGLIPGSARKEKS